MDSKSPREVIRSWIERFNAADIDGLATLYAEDAINDQVVFSKPLHGRDEVSKKVEVEFSRAKMKCIEE